MNTPFFSNSPYSLMYISILHRFFYKNVYNDHFGPFWPSGDLPDLSGRFRACIFMYLMYLSIYKYIYNIYKYIVNVADPQYVSSEAPLCVFARTTMSSQGPASSSVSRT